MGERGKQFLNWALVFAYAGLIFFLSSMPRPLPYMHEIQKKHLDWILHGVEYGVLGVLLVNALLGSFPRWTARAVFLTALAIGTAYAVSDEWHQSFVPERDANALDLAADFVGLSAAACVRSLKKGK